MFCCLDAAEHRKFPQKGGRTRGALRKRGAAKPAATTILSPYSALLALGMAANGAGGRTLEEMEYALGAKLDDLNAWLASCRAAEDGEVVSANSIWTRNGTVQLLPEFRQDQWSQNTARRSMPGLSVRPSTMDDRTQGRHQKLLERGRPEHSRPISTTPKYVRRRRGPGP